MSYGMVICEICHKEVHQDGPRDEGGRGTWRHCYKFHGGTPICEGAKGIYPQTREEIVGLFCQTDGLAPEPAVQE